MIKRNQKIEKSKNLEAKIIAASLKLALQKEWRQISFGDIAKAAKLPLIEIHQIFPSKVAILKAFNQQMNFEALANVPEFPSNTTVRDQLFELLMLQFDALTQHKKAISRIIRGTIGKDPIASIIGLESSWYSMKNILEAVGVRTVGPIGHLKINGLLIVYLKTTCSWLKDDSPDLSKTMADLDKGLARAEAFLQNLSIKH